MRGLCQQTSRAAERIAQAALTAMSAQLVEKASITVPVLGSHQDEAGMLADTKLTDALRLALRTLQATIDQEHEAEAAIQAEHRATSEKNS